jgi:hypothetical protein
MSQVKEFKVSLTEADEKAFNPGTRTRKRRVGVNAKTTKGGAADNEGAALAEGVPIPDLRPVAPSIATTSQSWIPGANSVSSAMPNMSALTTPHVGPTAADIPLNAGPPMKGGAVRLAAKKSAGGAVHSTNSHTNPSASVKNGIQGGGGGGGAAARILTTKKRSAPPPTTRKKPKLIIAPGTGPKHLAKSGSTENVSIDKNRTRKFRERRISIMVRPTARSAAKKIREKIAVMPIAQIKRTLIRKGILKPSGKTPPDQMMRSMLRDYLLLHTAD